MNQTSSVTFRQTPSGESVIESVSPGTTVTKGKAYSNAELGLSFMYLDTATEWRSGMELQDLGSEVLMFESEPISIRHLILSKSEPPPGHRIHIEITDDPRIYEYLKSNGDGEFKDVVINNLTFREFHFIGEGDSYGYVISQHGKHYVFESTFGPRNDEFEFWMKTVHFDSPNDALVPTATEPTADEMTFDGCGKLTKYESQPWYPALQATAKAQNIDLLVVNEACFSEDGHAFIFLISAAYMEVFSLFRFNTQTSILKQASLVPKKYNMGSGAEFGKREGHLIQILAREGDAGCGATMYFDYDLTLNSLELKKRYTMCEGDATGEWQNF